MKLVSSFVYILFLILNSSNCKGFQLIISILLHNQSITNLKSCINSILEQNVEHSFYKILLILSNKKKKVFLKKDFISFINKNGILLKTFNNRNNFQNRLKTVFQQYSEYPIIIINDKLIFPEGWLEMYIEDHEKYPNDIISGSIQYFIDQNLDIKNFSEGFNGKYFGKFNHITNLVFNFAFIYSQLGGALFPPKTFKSRMFYYSELFYKISKNSVDFWLSCFIMLENKVLRQSSKIYDYTQYIINKNEFINENQESIKTNLLRLFSLFPWFKNIVERRQKKVIISLTSYPQRFEFLPSVINSIQNQSLLIKNIKLVLFKEQKKLYKYKIKGIDIIEVNEDLKPHKKYYYTMSKFRDHAILTVDDDTIYCQNMVNSLYNSYIEHPNIVSGRGGHFMKYKNNGELMDYLSWFAPTNLVKNIDFNIFLIGVGGIIYPPDILNINKGNKNIIKEFLIGDDFVLKHLEIKKGIEQLLINNHHPQGLYMKNNTLHKPLFDINKYRNDVYIKNINTAIDNEIIKELCINYKNLKTGLTIHLFNINNIIINSSSTYFYIDAYSFCPIENPFNFSIKFNRFIAFCVSNETFSRVEENFLFHDTKRILVAFCSINKRMKNLNNFLFPKIIDSNNSNLIIQNKKKYIPIIYNDFCLIEKSKYILQLIFFKSFPRDFYFNFELNNIKLNCSLKEEVIYKNDEQPIIKNLSCFHIYSYDVNKIILISGLPKNNLEIKSLKSNEISNIFIISKMFVEKHNIFNFIIVKGKLKNDLEFNITDLKIDFTNPKESLFCDIQSGSKSIQFYISCGIQKRNYDDIFLENQVIYSKSLDYNILLINNETLFQNYRTFKNNNDFQLNYVIRNNEKYLNKVILIIILICVLIKRYFNNKMII